MKRLALFLSGLSGGGAQRRMVTLANAFAGRGYAVDVVVVRCDGPFREDLSPSVRLIVLDPWWTHLPGIRGAKGTRVLASAPALAAYLRRQRPDVLLSTSTPANVAALWARRGTRTPVVVSVNVHVSQATGARSVRYRSARPMLGRLVCRSFPRADGIIANSKSVASDVAAFTGLARNRITTVYNPVDTENIYGRAHSALDHPWFRPDAPPVVLGVGKLKIQKDFGTLIRAFAHMRSSRAARLLILGEGGEREHLTTLARELGVGDEMMLPGFVRNPAAYMRRAAVFVLSSRWEGFSNALAEALACGCPVVATDCPGGSVEILDHGSYGPLVPVGDPAALAAAMSRALDTPPDRERLRARAAMFSVERAADEYLVALRVACDRRNDTSAGVSSWL